MRIQTILYLWEWPGILIGRHVLRNRYIKYETRPIALYIMKHFQLLCLVKRFQASQGLKGSVWRVLFLASGHNSATLVKIGTRDRAGVPRCVAPHLPVTWNTLWFSFLIFFYTSLSFYLSIIVPVSLCVAICVFRMEFVYVLFCLDYISYPRHFLMISWFYSFLYHFLIKFKAYSC